MILTVIIVSIRSICCFIVSLMVCLQIPQQPAGTIIYGSITCILNGNVTIEPIIPVGKTSTYFGVEGLTVSFQLLVQVQFTTSQLATLMMVLFHTIFNIPLSFYLPSLLPPLP